MNYRRIVLLSLVVCLAAFTASADETFRCELTKFAQDLRGVRSLALDNSGPAHVTAMSEQELDAMQSALAPLSNWQMLPAILASVESKGEAHSRQLVGRLVNNGGIVAPDLNSDSFMSDEEFRQDFLFLVDQIGRFSPIMGADFERRVQRLHDSLVSMPAEAVSALRREWNRRAADIQQQLTQRIVDTYAIAAVGLRPISLGCNTDCGIDLVCWGKAVGCLIDEAANLISSIATFISDFFTKTIPGLISQIGQLGSQAIQWFTDVFNKIANFVTDTFNAVKNLLPQTPNDILKFVLDKTGIDLANIDWAKIASSIPTITPPCPTGDALKIIGDVCDSGADAVVRLLFDVAPGDGISLPLKLGLAVLNFPLAYLCQCRDTSDAIQAADEQAAHRALTGQQLDLALSTRATQASVDALSGSLTQLSKDVATVEAKIDRLGFTEARIGARVNKIEATTNRSETKVDTLTSGNSTQQTFISEFLKLTTRLHIEENLLGHGDSGVISQFQLPAAFGGKLETVSFIVADTINMTLAASQPIFGAARELQRGDNLLKAGDFIKAYQAYRSSYSEATK